MNAPKPDPRSGLDADGNWTPVFEGQRPPFEPGNQVAVGNRGGSGRPVEHDACSMLLAGEHAVAIADLIRSCRPHLTVADEPAVQALALILAQLERAVGVLGEVDEMIKAKGDVDRYLTRVERRGRLSSDARGWAREARRYMDDLGLTPASRAALEERTLTVIHVTEVQAAFSRWVRSPPFIPIERRREFLAALEASLHEHDVGVRELPLVPDGPADVDGARRDRADDLRRRGSRALPQDDRACSSVRASAATRRVSRGPRGRARERARQELVVGGEA